MSNKAALVYNLFAARPDVYAIRVEFPDRAVYVPSNGGTEAAERVVRKYGVEYTEEIVRAHLKGEVFIGVYPIWEDSTVYWFALDFDGKNGDPWQEAVRQAEILWKEAGLPVYIERSQSGGGYHVWGFLEQPVAAGALRHAIRPFLERADTYDRMFPNQDQILPTRPLGNLIALPLHGGRVQEGNSVFVRRGKDGQPEVIEDQFEYLESIRLISAEKIQELFEAAGEYVPETEAKPRQEPLEALRGSFKVTHPRFGCEFIRWCYEHPEEVSEPLWYALACQFAQLEDGRELFHEWSARDRKRYDPEITDKKFDHAIAENKPHSCEIIRGLGGHCECDRRFPGKVYHPFDLAKIPFKELVESIEAIETTDGFVLPANDGFDQAIEWVEAVERDPTIGQGYKYGISSIDAATGLRNSDLVIIAARPGMGKTAFAGFVMDNLARQQGVPNYFFSAEMSSLQFFKRQLSVVTGVSQTRMVTGQLTAMDWEKIRAFQEEVRKGTYLLYVDDFSRSSDRIFEVAAALVHEHGPGVIWIDYLQLLQRLPRESMFDAVTRITHDLKLLAKALNCPVVALTQLNRTADDATAESQTMDSWLRGSGDIEQTADVIIFILGEKGPGVKERILALHKERHRESGVRIELEFNQPVMSWGEKGSWLASLPTVPVGASWAGSEEGDREPPTVGGGDFEGGDDDVDLYGGF